MPCGAWAQAFWKTTPAQHKFHDEWKGPITILDSTDAVGGSVADIAISGIAEISASHQVRTGRRGDRIAPDWLFLELLMVSR